MSIELSSVANLLSSAASLGKLLEFSLGMRDRLLRSSDLKSEAISVLNSPRSEVSIGDKSVSVLAVGMSQGILDVLAKKIESLTQRLIAIYDEPDLTEVEMQQKAGLLRRNFCWIINEMKKYNGGMCPGPLEVEWIRVGCDSYKFNN